MPSRCRRPTSRIRRRRTEQPARGACLAPKASLRLASDRKIGGLALDAAEIAAEIGSSFASRELVHPLAPICDARTRVLILGSFPSVASLQARQYYGHPRNHFWRLLGAVIGQPLHEMEYAQRLPLVLAGGFGVWDVINTCRREGSLDSAIRGEQPNDFVGLVEQYPGIAKLALNGGKAASYRRVLEDLGREAVVLPSSSPANATYSFERKLAVWKELLSPAESASR